ncbi:hypothetical protein [Serratia fonticola]|uniref:hypothetical protein n=1 Tax=Serratia fonticola TaxID=47917 RepID=UPI001376C338|nr:hypothetical protein [Serratia fonticola]NCG50501.1 hypothetical protein [Serratia fonticola]
MSTGRFSLVERAIEFAEVTSFFPKKQGLIAPSPFWGPIELAEVTSLLPKEQGLIAPSPFWGPIEFAEVTSLLPKEQGLIAPSPCGLRYPQKNMKRTLTCDLLVALTKQKRPHRAFTNSLPEIFLLVFTWYPFLSY